MSLSLSDASFKAENSPKIDFQPSGSARTHCDVGTYTAQAPL